MKLIAIVLVTASCGYSAGSFRDWKGAFPGTVQTIGCVEIGVGTATDQYATGPVIAYSFGNRCTHAVTLDLATVRAVGRDADGRERTLTAFDPRGELRPVPLDGLWSAREQIEYIAVESAQLVSVCVDIGGVDASAPRTERWVCNDVHTTVASR